MCAGRGAGCGRLSCLLLLRLSSPHDRAPVLPSAQGAQKYTDFELSKVDWVLTGLLIPLLLLHVGRLADERAKPPTVFISYDQTRAEFLNHYGFLFCALAVDFGLAHRTCAECTCPVCTELVRLSMRSLC